MANNRMWLNVKGHPEKRILLAKYYPSTGWQIWHDQDTYNDWFNEHINDYSMWGKTNVLLTFEIEKDLAPNKPSL